jgi:hypothetical protein
MRHYKIELRMLALRIAAAPRSGVGMVRWHEEYSGKPGPTQESCRLPVAGFRLGSATCEEATKFEVWCEG